VEKANWCHDRFAEEASKRAKNVINVHELIAVRQILLR